MSKSLILPTYSPRPPKRPKPPRRISVKVKIAESFYYVNYGSSIIMSKVCQIISVMKTKTPVFPEK